MKTFEVVLIIGIIIIGLFLLGALLVPEAGALAIAADASSVTGSAIGSVAVPALTLIVIVGIIAAIVHYNK